MEGQSMARGALLPFGGNDPDAAERLERLAEQRSIPSASTPSSLVRRMSIEIPRVRGK